MDNGASSYRRFLDGDDKGLAEIVRDYRDGLILYLNGVVNNISVAEELMEEYSERKLIVIDTLCASMGEGLLLYKAVELRDQGKTMEEIAEWVENNKKYITLGAFEIKTFRCNDNEITESNLLENLLD